MQIRRRGDSIEFLRSSYNNEKKRCCQKLIGSMRYYLTNLPIDLRSKMSDTEIKEAELYLKKKSDDRHLWTLKSRLASTGKDLVTASKAISELGINENEAITIFEGIQAVTKALRKAGYTKTKMLTPRDQ